MTRKTAQFEASARHGGPERSSFRCAATGRLLVLGIAAAICLNSGCVYRRIIVRSDPPGARVILDGQEVGYTPTGIPFTYYGQRRLTLVKPGFETRSELVNIPPPWYQWVPLDFASDNFLGTHVADRHDISWQLSPQTVVPLDQLQQRADSLRSEAHMGQ
jgi:PEGA domain